MKTSTQLGLNGRDVVIEAEEGGMLLWALRTTQGLTGTKYGCGSGICGACTVLVDGRAVRSCVTPVSAVAGKAVTTVEGLAAGGRLDPVQQAFVEHGAFQCGFCTPGMLLAAHALLRANPRPSRQEIVAHMDHQLCRCGAHQRIVDAVEDAGRGLGATS
jgi:aerobic-type carbon monoxide dehydrogenase small subunit (CoxS/CutS family)